METRPVDVATTQVFAFNQTEHPSNHPHVEGTRPTRAIHGLAIFERVSYIPQTNNDWLPASRVKASTLLLLFATPTGRSNVVSTIPAGVTRASIFLIYHPTWVNVPPTIICPPDCTTIDFTSPLTLTLKVGSNAPVLVKRAKLLLIPAPTHVNNPPISIYPSDWTATAFIYPLILGSAKVRSSNPVEVKRATRLLTIEELLAPEAFEK